jgi:hypothetical protein
MSRSFPVMPVPAMVARMKPLPRRHRVAHLRALIRQQPRGSIRRRELERLLRAELTESSSSQVCAT